MRSETTSCVPSAYDLRGEGEGGEGEGKGLVNGDGVGSSFGTVGGEEELGEQDDDLDAQEDVGAKKRRKNA